MSSAPQDDDARGLLRVATTGPGKTAFDYPDCGLQFSSRFDGGNMASVQQSPSGAFHVDVAEDATAFGISTGYSTWFYFEVERGSMQCNKQSRSSKEVQLVLANLNPQRGLYKNGYTVMYSSVDGEQATTTSSCVFQDEKKWARLPTPLTFEKYVVSVDQTDSQVKEASAISDTEELQQCEEGGESGQEADGPDVAFVNGANASGTAAKPKQETKIRVSFTYQFKYPHERVRFAFCYPYTYARVQEELRIMDKRFASAATTGGNDPEKKSTGIYYHRELLTRSLEGLRVDLITISSYNGIMATREPARRKLQTPPSEGAFRFDPKQKKMVIISARVHAAETPANFMLDGMLQLLLHPTDPSAIALRQHFVFKIIPMLNPDGVCQGFYRTDTRGVNLNRVYENPQLEVAPTVFSLKELVLEYVDNYGGVNSASAQDNVVYLDLHAHANRRGCFVFGNNHLPDTQLELNNVALDAAMARQVRTQLFARLVSLHTPFFDYMACAFDKENMSKHDLRDNNNATTSRQGSSRVALYRATGLTYVYTIECNYNEGRRNLRASSLVASPSSPAVAFSFSGDPLKRCCSSKSPVKRVQPEEVQQIARLVAPTSGTRLYHKYSPAEWKDVGIGALGALLDLFELPGGGQRVEKSPFRSRDGICKNLLAEIKASVTGEGAVLVKTTKMIKQKSKAAVKQQIKARA